MTTNSKKFSVIFTTIRNMILPRKLTTFTRLSCSILFQGFKLHTIKQVYTIHKLSTFKREISLKRIHSFHITEGTHQPRLSIPHQYLTTIMKRKEFQFKSLSFLFQKSQRFTLPCAFNISKSIKTFDVFSIIMDYETHFPEKFNFRLKSQISIVELHLHIFLQKSRRRTYTKIQRIFCSFNF